MNLLLRIFFVFSFVVISNLFSQKFTDKDQIPKVMLTPFSGTWIRTEPDTVILSIENYSVDSFAFTMQSFSHDYYGFIGGSDDGLFKYAVKDDSIAYFVDLNAYSDGHPLYRQGEEPCKLIFKIINDNFLLVGERNCFMIYGGAGVTWEGEYKRTMNNL